MDIREYVFSKRDFIKNTLAELVKIPSVKADAQPGAPFGTECRNVLEKVSEIYRENGFAVKEDYDGGFVVAEYGNSENTVGLYAHGDVVPTGDGWIITEPFNMAEKDGFFVGRGVSDDKCGVVMSLVAAMAIRELKLPFNKKLVMFTGSNEETGMCDINNFCKTYPMPMQNIVLDAEFPAFRGEKSMVRFYAKSPRITDKNLTSVSGGEATNIVLGKAEAIFAGEKITAEGISKHAAHPYGSLNAGVPLFEKLIEKADTKTAQILSQAKEMLSYYDGTPFGIKFNDADFGELTCTNGVIKFEDGCILLSFDARFGLSVSADEIADTVTEKLALIGWEAIDVKKNMGFIIPEDNPLVKNTVKLWEEYTGKKGKAVLSGGGTYSRVLKNSVSIGTQLTDGEKLALPEGHGEEHQPDECVSINGLLNATAFVTELLLRL